MAAVSANAELCSSINFTSQEILNEVRHFLRGTVYDGKVNKESLAKSALFLLRTLPAARHAVLEHMCHVFDEAVMLHIQQLECSATGITPEHIDESSCCLEPIIQDACSVLLNFIKSNPVAWAPIISAWSLGLLGHISTKYADQRSLPRSSSLNEVLQLWMTCPPTKTLTKVATECFAAMVVSAPDVCVDALLEASVQYSPHFDWFVAHIGSCFPMTIISRVLMCGLKDFCTHRSKRPSNVQMVADKKIPKLASVVCILGHLASKHCHSIQKSLMNLFQDSFLPGANMLTRPTLPFLLQLASMSPMLLHILTTDLVKTLSPSVLNTLHSQFAPWKSANMSEFDNFLQLVIHLIMKSDVGAYQVIEFLLNSASPLPSKHQGKTEEEVCCNEVQQVCKYFLNHLCSELQKVVFLKQDSKIMEVPLLNSLSKCQTTLARDFLNSSGQRSEWYLKLLTCTALYGCSKGTCDSLAVLLVEAKHPSQLIKFLQMQKEVEIGDVDILQWTLSHIVDSLQTNEKNNINRWNLLRNLLHIVQWEKNLPQKGAAVCRSSIVSNIHHHFETFMDHLNHPDLSVCAIGLKLLIAIGLPPTSTISMFIKACSVLTSLFFHILHSTEGIKSLHLIQLCHSCYEMICNVRVAQSMCVQFLLEEAFSSENAALFGSKLEPSLDWKQDSNNRHGLLEENQKMGMSLPLPRSYSRVNHAGIIGTGLKPKPFQPPLSEEQISRNRQSLLDVLWTCSYRRLPPSADNRQKHIPVPLVGADRVSSSLSRQIASILVTQLTPDMLYNGPAWPDEEFIKVTVERDLWVWRKFEDNPLLWDILDNFAHSSSVLFYCSPLLRSLVATLMNFYESCRTKDACDSPKYLHAACKVINYMRKSNLLSPPLCYIGELMPLVKSYELYLLLQTVWRYMKENPPVNNLDHQKKVCDAKFSTVIRSVLHANIAQTGSMYKRFFTNNMEGPVSSPHVITIDK
ncbi:integrator complex subunit 5-like [Argonauta hians]